MKYATFRYDTVEAENGLSYRDGLDPNLHKLLIIAIDNCCRAPARLHTILDVTRSSCFFVFSRRPSYILSIYLDSCGGDVSKSGGKLSIQVGF